MIGTDAVIGSVAGCAAAVTMAFFLVVKDYGPLSVRIFSVLTGLVVGAAVAFWAHRRLRRESAMGLEKLSEALGLLIWVRVRSPEKEAEAQEILLRHGAEAVHVHEIELAKRTEDLPLHSQRKLTVVMAAPASPYKIDRDRRRHQPSPQIPFVRRGAHHEIRRRNRTRRPGRAKMGSRS